MWMEYNPNPTGRRVEDCAIRALTKALDWDWEKTYAIVCSYGFAMGDMPHSNSVWGAVLRENGFKREAIPNTCPECYNAEDFCNDHPEGLMYSGSVGIPLPSKMEYSTTVGVPWKRYRNTTGRNARRDSMGRYSSGNEMMMEQLQDLMEESPDDRTRQEIQKLMSKLG